MAHVEVWGRGGQEDELHKVLHCQFWKVYVFFIYYSILLGSSVLWMPS